MLIFIMSLLPMLIGQIGLVVLKKRFQGFEGQGF
jgi:hypothetical protein